MKTTERIGPSQAKVQFTELRLRNDRLELAIVPEFGLHWTRLRVSVKGEWLDLLSPAPSQAALVERPTGCGSYTMAPWSNRIAKGQFEFDGRRFALRQNFRDGTAIHGDVRTRPWKVLSARDDHIEAVLDSREFPDFNFPFKLLFHQSLDLFPEGLRVSLCIENVDRGRAPVGLGFHPFLKRRLTLRDRDVILVVPAERVYPAEGCIPTGPPVAVSGRTDLRALKSLGNPDLDHCFTGLKEDCLRVFYPGTGVGVRFQLGPVFTHVAVYAPNGPDGEPLDFVAVEPVTHVNDGFNCLARGWKDTGVKVLEPQEAWGESWELLAGDI